MKKLGSIMKMVKRSSKKILKYTAMSFIICYASAVVLRVMNAFLGANTPDFWWYFVPATLVALALSGLMVLANFDKVFRKPTKKKAVAKQKVHRKSAPAVSTPEREYRRKVS